MVLAASPVSWKLVTEPATDFTFDPSRSTSYPVTPTLSVEAVQVIVADVALFAVAVTPAGTLGAVLSPVAVPTASATLSMSNVAPAAGAASTMLTVSESPLFAVV